MYHCHCLAYNIHFPNERVIFTAPIWIQMLEFFFSAYHTPHHYHRRHRRFKSEVGYTKTYQESGVLQSFSLLANNPSHALMSGCVYYPKKRVRVYWNLEGCDFLAREKSPRSKTPSIFSGRLFFDTVRLRSSCTANLLHNSTPSIFCRGHTKTYFFKKSSNKNPVYFHSL